MEILRLSVGEPSSAAHRSPHQDRRAPDRSAAGSRPSSTHSCNQYRKNPDNPPPPKVIRDSIQFSGAKTRDSDATGARLDRTKIRWLWVRVLPGSKRTRAVQRVRHRAYQRRWGSARSLAT